MNQDSISNSEDKTQIANLRSQVESYRDFIGWLFDNPDDEGIHWMTESEAWTLFENHQSKHTTKTHE